MHRRNAEQPGWFTAGARAAPPDNALPLVCIPHAGAGATAYGTWPSALPEWIAVASITLPGRGARLHETLRTSMDAVVDAVAPAFAEWVTGTFALFGHSLGALIAYELTHRLANHHGLQPEVLFVSGRAAPHLPRRLPTMHRESDARLVELLGQTYGAMPDAVAQNQELLELFLPALRADLTILESYRFPAHDPLSTDIVVLGAQDDPTTTSDELAAWTDLTRGRTTMRVLDAGGHFFPRTRRAEVTEIVSDELGARLVP